MKCPETSERAMGRSLSLSPSTRVSGPLFSVPRPSQSIPRLSSGNLGHEERRCGVEFRSQASTTSGKILGPNTWSLT